MKKTSLLALALAAILPANLALASDAVDPAIESALRDQLTADGYDVRKIKMEDGLVEAYVVKDGDMAELYFTTDLEPVEHSEDDES